MSKVGQIKTHLSIEDRLKIDTLCDAFEARLGTAAETTFSEYLHQLSEENSFQQTLLYELVLVALAHERYDLLRDFLAHESGYHLEVVARACRYFGNPDLSSLISTPKHQVKIASFPKTERFQCLRKIGSGGMGNVYEAFDRERNMLVAVKTLHSLSGETLHQFKKEFRTLAELDHPNLVRFYEFFQSDQHWYFTMELVQGCDVLTHCRDRHSGNLTMVRHCLIQIVYGLDFLHQSGTIHRDLKPSNILVTKNGELKILDFGLILNLSQATPSGELVGTPTYMSPEQMTGQALGPASDWFSVGLILNELLAGEPRIIQAPPFLESQLYELAQKLTEKSPKKRLTCPEIFEALELAPLPKTSTDSDLFVGRQEILQQLNKLTPQAKDQNSNLVVLSGRSGEGKSALAQHHLAQIRQRPDSIILASRCYDYESVQYPGIDGLADELSNHLASFSQKSLRDILPKDLALLIQIFPGLGKVPWPNIDHAQAGERKHSGDPRTLRSRAALSFRELLAKLAERSSLILFIDDFQWAGEDSRTLFISLLKELPSCFVLLACRAEKDHLNTLLTSIRPLVERSPTIQFIHLQLTPFTRGEVDELAHKISNHKNALDFTENELQQIHTESGGHAYLLNELLRKQNLPLNPRAKSEALIEILQTKIRNLSKEKLSLLEVISLSTIPLTTREAYQLAEISEVNPSQIRQLTKEKFITSSQPGTRASLVPYHDAVREAVIHSISAEKKKYYHQRLVAHFHTQENHIAPQVIATHLEQAGQAETACSYFRDAAEQALRSFAFEQASEYFRKSLKPHHVFKHAELTKVKHGLIESLENAGRYHEAADELHALATQQKNKKRTESLKRAALLYCSSGHLDQGLKLLKELLKTEGYIVHHGRKIRNGLSWTILQWSLILKLRRRQEGTKIETISRDKAELFLSAACGLSLIDPFVAAHLMIKGAHLALESRDQKLLGKALALNASYQASGSQQLQRQTEKLDPFVKQLCEDSESPHSMGLYLFTKGVMISHRGHLIEAAPHLQEAEKILSTKCRGVWWELAVTRTTIIWNLSLLGKLIEMDQFIHGFLEETKKRNDLFMSANIHTYPVPLILLSKDSPEEAAKVSDQAITMWSRNPGFHIQHYTHMVGRAMIYLYSGQAAQASLFFEDRWQVFSRSGMLLFPYMKMWSLDARITVAFGAAAYASSKKAESHFKMIRACLKSLRSVQLDAAPSLSLRFEGVLAHLLGDRKKAINCLSLAASGLRKHGLKAYALSTEHLVAEIEARPCSAETISGFEQCGIQDPKKWRRAQMGI